MAYSYVWPLSLPQSPQKGFTESIGVNVIRTPMDAGISKMRRRSARPSTMDVTFILTSAQVVTLETFVVDTLKGTRRFGFTHPRTNNIEEVRIVPQQEGVMYSLTYLAPGFYSAKLTFEILP